MSSEFQIKRYEPAYVQITQHLREQILSGVWKPGSRLPPIQEMAKRFQTNYRTVHIALTPLVKEGLIVRIHGSGTFIRERIAQLSCAGIYHSADFLGEVNRGFYQALNHAFRQAFQARKIETNVWIDSRPEESQTTVLPALMQAIERQEIQSLVVGMVVPLAVGALERLPLPTCFTGGAANPDVAGGFVWFDERQMVRAAVEELRRQGCRTVGLITHYHTVPSDRDRMFRRHTAFFDEFRASAVAHGMATQPSWIAAPENYRKVSEQLGYDLFKQLWDQPERPDGIVVFPDTLARGVVTACVERGVSVPRDLKFVFHRNAEIEFLCPLPVSWVEVSAARLAETAVEQVLKQFRGETVRPIYLPCQLYPVGGTAAPVS